MNACRGATSVLTRSWFYHSNLLGLRQVFRFSDEICVGQFCPAATTGLVTTKHAIALLTEIRMAGIVVDDCNITFVA